MSVIARMWLVANEDYAHFFPVFTEAEVDVYRSVEREIKGPFVPAEHLQEAVAENSRLRAFAFGDAPEWEKANATLKHRVRELEAEVATTQGVRRGGSRACREAARALAEWTQHSPACARAKTTANSCTCGLQEAWLAIEVSAGGR